MHEYTFKIKKGDVEIELKTDNISFFEQQVNNWNDKLLNIKYEEPEKIFVEKENLESEIKESNELEQEDIERESQRILDEYKAELQQEEQQKEEFNQEIQDIIEETKDSEDNFQQQNQEIETNLTKNLDNHTEFDALLEESMSQCISNIQQNRDENFINHVKEKNITEKIDFLITTAYYLENNEHYATFTLNQVNKKLTENSFESVEYSVMQDAVDNGFAEVVPVERATETEYRLTDVYKNFVAERAQNV